MDFGNSIIVANNTPIDSVFEFVQVQQKVLSPEGKVWTPIKDDVVYEEIIKMSNISTSCYHTSAKHKSSISFERIPREISSIQTIFGSLDTTCTSNIKTQIPTRQNDVTGMLICFITALSDFSSKMTRQNTGSGTFIVTNVMSTVQTTMMAIVFEAFCKCYRWNPSTKLCIITSDKRIKSIRRYITNLEHVGVYETDKESALVRRICSTVDDLAEVGVLTLDKDVFELCDEMKAENISVHLIMNITSFETMNWCTEKAKKHHYVLQPVVVNESKTPRYMLSTTMTCDSETNTKPLCTVNMRQIMSHYRYYDTMIRHMNINNMCYDCWVCYMISSSMTSLMNKPSNETGDMILNDQSTILGSMDTFTMRVDVEVDDPEVHE